MTWCITRGKYRPYLRDFTQVGCPLLACSTCVENLQTSTCVPVLAFFGLLAFLKTQVGGYFLRVFYASRRTQVENHKKRK